MIRLFVALVLTCIPVALSAQDWTLRQGRIPLAYGALQDLGGGNGLAPKTEDRRRYSFNQKKRYTLGPQEDINLGSLELRRDGRVCIGGGGGNRDCDLYVREGGLRLLLGETRARTPFRLELGLKP